MQTKGIYNNSLYGIDNEEADFGTSYPEKISPDYSRLPEDLVALEMQNDEYNYGHNV